jgi:anthranilate/para-aminobenzoate synthase component I
MDFAKLKNEEYVFFSKGKAAFGALAHTSQIPISGKWYGYIGYNYRHALESYPTDKPSIIDLPPVAFVQFANEEEIDLPEGQRQKAIGLKSNMTDAEYVQKVEYIIDRIKNGDLYQANLTRKFYGEFAIAPHGLDVFATLCAISPAPYATYMRLADVHIISASPECFLKIENGTATTTPIKGTLPAHKNPGELLANTKERAENLMITDLMRNDLSRTCSNVVVKKLFEVTSYPQYHHLSSTIQGTSSLPAKQVIEGCFPPGSMTGAPKIAAVSLCSKLEGIERGLYSGVMGWVNGNSCDLSVVIRTIIIKGNKFEFQVGGGIVADSNPQRELEETYVKSSAIRQVLGII